MYEKKSVPSKKVLRPEQVVRYRLRDEMPLSETQVADFGAWLDGELLILESTYRSFVTRVSKRGSVGR